MTGGAHTSKLWFDVDKGLFAESAKLSLRDYFAGQALSAMAIQIAVADPAANIMASSAYAIADAMLSARSQKEGE